MKRNTSLEYRKKLNGLVALCKQSGIKVRFVKGSTLKDFAGMNDEASRKFGFHRLPDDTILIDKGMPVKTQYKNLIHEVEEMVRMEKLDIPYWKAHVKALSVENKGLSKFVKDEMEKGV